MSDAPDPAPAPPQRRPPHIWRYVLIGAFTVAPLAVTWLVFDFLFSLLARAGAPLPRAAARAVHPFAPAVAAWLDDPAVQYVLAAALALAALYGIGLLASVVVGRKVIATVEGIVERLPGAQVIYGATKRLLETLREPPPRGQRVVLIAFPTAGMRAIGFVTRIFRDQATGRELAAVYVPTSPNPTSGYIEIVPLADVVPTDWSVEEAMRFVMTGGATAPDHLPFTRPPHGGGPPPP